jgi:hypothetical protein
MALFVSFLYLTSPHEALRGLELLGRLGVKLGSFFASAESSSTEQ